MISEFGSRRASDSCMRRSTVWLRPRLFRCCPVSLRHPPTLLRLQELLLLKAAAQLGSGPARDPLLTLGSVPLLPAGWGPGPGRDRTAAHRRAPGPQRPGAPPRSPPVPRPPHPAPVTCMASAASPTTSTTEEEMASEDTGVPGSPILSAAEARGRGGGPRLGQQPLLSSVCAALLRSLGVLSLPPAAA
jgi:hypothetical protein